MFEKIYQVDANGRQVKMTANDLQIMADNDQVSDLNLIYRANSKKAFVAFRLSSWLDKEKLEQGIRDRVVKFLVEVGTYDSSKPKGQRQKDYIQIFMDEDEFSYFCGLLKNGRIMDVMDRKANMGEKIAYLLHNGKGDAKRLRIYRGSKLPIILEAAQGPGKLGSNNQTLPDDWEGRNKDKVSKAMIGLSEQEAGKMGAAGERALAVLDMWRAFGRDEENLGLINIRKKGRQQSARDYDRGYSPRPQQRDNYNNGSGYYNGGYA